MPLSPATSDPAPRAATATFPEPTVPDAGAFQPRSGPETETRPQATGGVEARDPLLIAREIVQREGGFVDDPDDPGGATKHGVTLGTLVRLGIDLDGDGQVGRSDLHALSAEQAAEIFLRHYFHAPRLGLLPPCLKDSVFDMYVNSGSAAVALLQRLLVRMGFDLRIDARMGPLTARAAQQAAGVDADSLRDAYGIARRSYYFALADRRPQSRKYARSRDGGKGGWITRAERFVAPAYHLSAQEFATRTRRWNAEGPA